MHNIKNVASDLKCEHVCTCVCMLSCLSLAHNTQYTYHITDKVIVIVMILNSFYCKPSNNHGTRHALRNGIPNWPQRAY